MTEKGKEPRSAVTDAAPNTGELESDCITLAGDRQSLAPLLTYRKVAELLGVSDRSVYALVRRGELVAVRVGGQIRFDPKDIRAYIAKAKGVRNGG